MSNHIYFVAQTGTIRFEEPKAPGNFYVYRLDRAHLGKVKLIVEQARLATDGTLIYPADFVAWLDRVDRGSGGGR